MLNILLSLLVPVAAILVSVACQPLVETTWPSIMLLTIGGVGASSYVPVFASSMLSLVAGIWVRGKVQDRAQMWVSLIGPLLWLGFIIWLMVRGSAGPIAVNPITVCLLLSGVVPALATGLGWYVSPRFVRRGASV